MKYFIAYVFAYLIIKVIYWLFDFYPFQEFSFFVGLLVDLSTWIVLSYLFVFLFGKLFKSNEVENE